MREIKFRGKRIDNGEWVYGYLFRSTKSTVKAITLGYYIQVIGEDLTHISYEVVSETVGQFTGLLDRNGVEIYEGDIVRFCDDPPYFSDYIIKYDEERLLWIADGVNDFTDDLWELECEFVRVIGNIYDDSEMLKDK